jgi:hypothetical protein
MTDYAGKSSTLKAVATTAHCAIDGYMSAIEASQSVNPFNLLTHLCAEMMLKLKALRNSTCLRQHEHTPVLLIKLLRRYSVTKKWIPAFSPPS